jgi:hypothetical protein
MFFGLLQNKKFKLRWFLSGVQGPCTLNLYPDVYREPCKPLLSGVEVSARIALWLAVMQRCEHIA